VGPRVFDHDRHIHDPDPELESTNVPDLLVQFFEARDELVRVEHVRVYPD
jgi:hypothetical protein